MFKHLWVERGMLSGLTKKTCILVKVILSSTLAAGIVQNSLLAKWRRLEATSSTRIGNSSHLLAIEFLSQITNTLTRIRNVRLYVRIIGERSEPLSDKLGGEICIATRALVCIYIYMRTA